MKNKFLCGILLMSVLTSCVSKKVYTELEDKHTALKKEARQLSDDNDALSSANNQFDLENAALQKSLNERTSERDKLKSQLQAAENNLQNLQTSYAALEKNSDDVLQSNMAKNRELLAELEAKERDFTGIKSLKIGYNRVFGYYIEITKSQYQNIPEGRYVRKQTLANAERFITEDLKTMEDEILGADEKL